MFDSLKIANGPNERVRTTVERTELKEVLLRHLQCFSS